MGQVQAPEAAQAAKGAPTDPYTVYYWLQELRRVATKVYAPLTATALATLRETTATYGRAQGVDRHLLEGLRVFISLFQLPEVPWQYGIGMQELFMAPSYFYTHRFDRIVNALLRADTPQALARVLESTDTMALVDSVCLLFAMESTRCPLAMTVYRSTNGTEDRMPVVVRVVMGAAPRGTAVTMVQLHPSSLVRMGFALSTTMWANCSVLTVPQGAMDGHDRPFGFGEHEAGWSGPVWAKAFLASSPLHALTCITQLLEPSPDASGCDAALEAVRKATSAPHKWFAAEVAAGRVWVDVSEEVQARLLRSPTFKYRSALIVAGLTEFLSDAVPTYLRAAAEGAAASTASSRVALLRAWTDLVFARVGMLLRRVDDDDAFRPGDCIVARPTKHDTPRWRLEANGSIVSLWEARARDVERLTRTPLGHTTTMVSFTSTSIKDDTEGFGEHQALMHVGVGVHALPIFMTGSRYNEQELLLGPASQALRVPASASDKSTAAVFNVTPPSAAQAAAARCCTDTEFQPIVNLKVALALAAMALPHKVVELPSFEQRRRSNAEVWGRVKQVAAVMLGGDTTAALERIRGVCIALLTRRARNMFPTMHRAVVSRVLPSERPFVKRRAARLGASHEAPAAVGATKKRRRQLAGGGTPHLVDVWEPSFKFCVWQAVFEAIGGRQVEHTMLGAIRRADPSSREAAAAGKQEEEEGEGAGRGKTTRLAPPPVALYERAQHIMATTAAEFSERTTDAIPWYLTHVGNALLTLNPVQNLIRDLHFHACCPLEAWSQSVESDWREIVGSVLYLQWDSKTNQRPDGALRVLLPTGVPLTLLSHRRWSPNVARVRLKPDITSYLAIDRTTDEKGVSIMKTAWRSADARRECHWEPVQAHTHTRRGETDRQVVRGRAELEARTVFMQRWTGKLWNDTKFHEDY